MDNNSGTAKCWGTGVAGEEGRGGGAGRGDGRDYEVEDIIGRRKHALAVETPRTVLFRLVGFCVFVFLSGILGSSSPRKIHEPLPALKHNR